MPNPKLNAFIYAPLLLPRKALRGMDDGTHKSLYPVEETETQRAGARADGDGLRGADLQPGGGERLHDPP